MIISLIAAMDRNRLIGINNRMPWHLPADLAHFKSLTFGKPVVMGRKTFESIGKPLPGRTNIVLTRNPEISFDGVRCVDSFENAKTVVSDADELMIIGGSTLYEILLPEAHRLYLTLVDARLEGDAWFPRIDYEEWVISKEEKYPADEKNNYNCSFITYDRKSPLS